MFLMIINFIHNSRNYTNSYICTIKLYYKFNCTVNYENTNRQKQTIQKSLVPSKDKILLFVICSKNRLG